jgi:hypothetical protein
LIINNEEANIMKKLLLITLLAFNVNSSELAGGAEIEARCFFWGSIAGLKQSTLDKHKKLASQGLSENDMAFEIGFAAGIAQGLAKENTPQSVREKTYQLYATICLKA